MSCSAPPSNPDPQASELSPRPSTGTHTANTLRIGTWNVRRLFDDVCDSGRCTPGSYEQVPSLSALVERSERLAAAIASLQVDILLLQEIENQRALDTLREAVGDVFQTALLAETGGAASLDVALFSRFPLLSRRGHREHRLLRPDGSSTRFARELLETHFELDGLYLITFNAHFKSQRNDDPGRRLAEAAAVAEIVGERRREYPNALIVVGGDLNDTPGSPTLQALEKSNDLRRLADELSGGADGTYIFNNQAKALDHLYASPSPRATYIAGSVRVARGSGGRGLADSDHAALHADFSLGSPEESSVNPGPAH